MEYKEVDNVTMEPDVFDGPECREHRPRWMGEYPKTGKHEIGSVIQVKAKDHPPGTQIIIKEPLCPKCGKLAENCIDDNECDFDWHKWADKKFA